jgi:hypothetical protein
MVTSSAVHLLAADQAAVLVVALFIDKMRQKFMQRALTALCTLSLLNGCSTPPCREWIFNDIIASCPSYNSGRLLLQPDNAYTYLEVEILRSKSGIRMYLNILLMEARPCEENPQKAKVEIILADETLTVYAHILKGGQRLLLPGEVADLLIDTLLDDQCFTIQVGAKKIVIVPDRFQESYNKFLQVEMAVEE